MSTSVHWHLDQQPSGPAIQELRQRLAAFNVAHSRIAEESEFAIFLRDADDHLQGGVAASIWGRVLEIDFLWIGDELRGQGYGARLLAAVEAEGARRGCAVAALNTYSFQAPEFYRKHGYDVYGVVEGYPDDQRKYFLKKRLAPHVDLS
jgi:GNAT superfamily N-acetyltransferase